MGAIEPLGKVVLRKDVILGFVGFFFSDQVESLEQILGSQLNWVVEP